MVGVRLLLLSLLYAFQANHINFKDYTVPALDVDMDEVRRTFETNIIGVIHMCKVFTPLIIEAKGTIVQIGSVAGVRYVFQGIEENV